MSGALGVNQISGGLGTSDCKAELCTRHILANSSIDRRAESQIAVERLAVLDFRRPPPLPDGHKSGRFQETSIPPYDKSIFTLCNICVSSRMFTRISQSDLPAIPGPKIQRLASQKENVGGGGLPATTIHRSCWCVKNYKLGR